MKLVKNLKILTDKAILGYAKPKICRLMYLGNTNDCVMDYDTYLAKILLMTSKTIITRNWYKTELPTIEQ